MNHNEIAVRKARSCFAFDFSTNSWSWQFPQPATEQVSGSGKFEERNSNIAERK